MSKFNRRTVNFRPVPTTPIMENKPIEKVIDGVKTLIDNEVDITDPALSDTMPTPEEYTFENLKAANVGLDPVGTIVLTPSTPDVVNALASSALDKIKD